VLLPVSMLLRRGDFAALIGRALELTAAGLGHRPIASAVGVSRSTVRGWLSRFAAVAEPVRAHLVRWALELDDGLVRFKPSGRGFGDAIATIAAAADELGIGRRWSFGGSSRLSSRRSTIPQDAADFLGNVA
jgi:hypothetical protein